MFLVGTKCFFFNKTFFISGVIRNSQGNRLRLHLAACVEPKNLQCESKNNIYVSVPHNLSPNNLNLLYNCIVIPKRCNVI